MKDPVITNCETIQKKKPTALTKTNKQTKLAALTKTNKQTKLADSNQGFKVFWGKQFFTLIDFTGYMLMRQQPYNTKKAVKFKVQHVV